MRQLNDDLKHFAYAASHDLQEPLRMVSSYTQLLAMEYKGKLGKDADQFIDYAVEGAQRMEALLKGMREILASQRTRGGASFRRGLQRGSREDLAESAENHYGQRGCCDA